MTSNGYNGLRPSSETITKFDKLDQNVRELIQYAIDARQKAYVPYSQFKVGAAIRTPDGHIFTGCNIESVSYTPTVCAERVAIGTTVCQGFREFNEIAVVADLPDDEFCTPCGVCRQMIIEFVTKRDTKIYMCNSKRDQVLITTISELLPRSFKPTMLQ